MSSGEHDDVSLSAFNHPRHKDTYSMNRRQFLKLGGLATSFLASAGLVFSKFKKGHPPHEPQYQATFYPDEHGWVSQPFPVRTLDGWTILPVVESAERFAIYAPKRGVANRLEWQEIYRVTKDEAQQLNYKVKVPT